MPVNEWDTALYWQYRNIVHNHRPNESEMKMSNYNTSNWHIESIANYLQYKNILKGLLSNAAKKNDRKVDMNERRCNKLGEKKPIVNSIIIFLLLTRSFSTNNDLAYFFFIVIKMFLCFSYLKVWECSIYIAIFCVKKNLSLSMTFN